MKMFFWMVVLSCFCVPVSARAQKSISGLEKRIESWRPLIPSGDAAAVIDSCAAMLPLLSAQRQPRLRALALSLQATATTQMGQPAAALLLHRQALALRRRFLGEAHLETANSYQNTGNCLLALGRSQEAGVVLKKAVGIKERLFDKNAPELIRIYNSIGQFYQGEFDFVQAHLYLERALDIAVHHFSPQGLPVIPRLLALADLYTAENNHDAALVLLRRAYDIQVDSSWDDHRTKAVLLKNLGNALGAKGAYAEALQWLNTALQYSEQQLDLAAEVRSDLLLSIGNVLLDQGDFAAAEVTLRTALAGFPARNSARADVLNSLGLALRYRGRPEAVDTLVVAGNLYLRGALNPADQRAVAGIWLNVGNFHLDRSDYVAARYYFEKALAHLRQTPGAATAQAACWDKIAVCRAALGQPAAASTIWLKLLHDRRLLPVTVVYSILYNRGEYYLQQQHWTAATADFQEALSLLQGSGPALYTPFPYEYIQTLTGLARVCQARAQQHPSAADWTQALDWAQQAVDALQRLKTQVRAGRSAVELQQVFDTPFDIAVTANMALNKPEAAWQFAELFKSNFLQKLSWQAARAADFHLPANWIKNDIAWNNALAYYQRIRSEPAAQSPDRQAALADSIQQISGRLYQLRQDISEHYPEVYQYLYEPGLPTLTAVKAALGTKQSLLTYHWGAPDRVYAFVIRHDTFVALPLVVDPHTALAVFDFFQHCAQNPYRLPDSVRTAYCEELITLGQSLYQQLAAPLEPLLAEQVLIIPDAILCLLPFEALVTQRSATAYRMDQHHYWLQDHPISYAHSAASWLAMRLQTLPGEKKSLLVVAPDFAYNTKGLPPLQYNQSEAAAVCRVTSGAGLSGPQARKAAFLQQAGQYSALHLATHGVMDDQEPLASFVAFTELPNDTAGNNLLYVSDIYSASFPAELIVLSACQTASGQLYRGEGLLSIAQAFQFAGAQSLVASLWNVDDKRTPALMESFFKNLWQKMPKNDALNRAKRSYLESWRGLDAHPCFWAGLLLTGNEKSLTQTGGTQWWWAIGAALVAASVWWYWKRAGLR